MTNDIDVKDERITQIIHHLIRECNETPDTFNGELTTEMVQSCLKIMLELRDVGQMKLINRAIKEMRHAYQVFNRYPQARCVSIFGSSRTPENHPDYQSAQQFASLMSKEGWMCITGAAEGIMRAGIQGAQRDSSFGLSIRLPFEDSANVLIKGDPKLMIFRYFFTRKLMFISHADAIAAFPGGFGTMDELFEVLTLMQTGKSHIVPVILLEGNHKSYWEHWQQYVNEQLLKNGWISPEDLSFYYIAKSPEDAQKHVIQFYKNYHSSRYVQDLFVIRLLNPLKAKKLRELNAEFGKLLSSGEIVQGEALPEETDFRELPRLLFLHTRKNFGSLRRLIDKINE